MAARTGKTPEHVRPLLEMPNFSRKKARKLAEEFPTRDALAAAPLEAIQQIKGIGPELAHNLYRVTSGAATVSSFTVSSFAGEARVAVWNKITKKKVAGAAAPKASEADAWLKRNAESHERYMNQDAQIEGPKDASIVPEDCLMSVADYEVFCAEADDGTGLARLQATLAEYGLRQVCAPTSVPRVQYRPPTCLIVSSHHYTVVCS